MTNNLYDALTDEQRNFVHLALDVSSFENLILSSKAGTGKSLCLRVLKDLAFDRGLKVRYLSPTGVAALNIGGMTIDKYLSFLNSSLRKPNSRGDSPDIIVIDECSMVRADKFDQLNLACQNMTKYRAKHRASFDNDFSFSEIEKSMEKSELPFGGAKVVLVGDLFQLPPFFNKQETALINKYSARPYFFKSKVFESSQNFWKFCFLTKVFRQDENENDLKMMLNEVRVSGKFSSQVVDYLNVKRSSNELRGVGITATNAVADGINRTRLDAIESESNFYFAEIEQLVEDDNFVLNEKDYPAERQIELKVGAKVVCIKNVYQEGGMFPDVCNGDSGEVVGMSHDSISFYCDRTKTTFEIEKQEWEITELLANGETIVKAKFIQLPFRLAWCLTVHKSQGMTLDEITIYPDRNGFWETGQLYVALSRATSMSRLWVCGRLKYSDVRVCQESLDFLKNKEESYGSQAV